MCAWGGHVGKGAHGHEAAKSRVSLVLACSVLALVLSACGSDSDGNDQPGGNNQPNHEQNTAIRTVSGVSQKGPFIRGATVTVQELDGSLNQTGKSFTGEIRNDKGEFSVNSVPLASQYAYLSVNGYYCNEIAGSNSGPITLKALVDISDRNDVNINLLTHLETDRVTHLVTKEHKSFADAKKQARQEILGAFGFSGNFGASETLSIFGASEDAAMLLAVSVIVQGNSSESELTARLSRISDDLADGTIDDEDIWQDMTDWAKNQNLAIIRNHVESWGETDPDFEKYVREFSTKKIVNPYKTTCEDTNKRTNFFVEGKGNIVDYLISICELDKFYKNASFVEATLEQQKIGAACFCYGPTCNYAGYERPEWNSELVEIWNETKKVAGATLYGCDGVPVDYHGAVRSCFRSLVVDGIEPAMYFPNGSCALAMSECIPSEICDPSDNSCLGSSNPAEYARAMNENTICSFTKFGNYTGDFATAAESFKAEGCPDGQVMLDFVMNIKLTKLKRAAKINIRGCFQGCETDADCHGYNITDPVTGQPSQLKCVTTREDENTHRKARVCFDKHSVEFTDAKDVIFVDTGTKVDSNYIVSEQN